MRVYVTETPGLAVQGDSRCRDWRVIHEPSGLPVAPAQLGNMMQGFRRLNMFETRRDALAAAGRLAEATPYVPWDGSAEEIRAAIVESNIDHAEHQRTMVRALVGQTPEEIARENDERRRREHRRAMGEEARDTADAMAREHGHDLDWRKSGQRSWRGHCQRCDAEVRVSYQSRSRSHAIKGAARACAEARVG